jgi:hypothetical protein
MNPKLILCLALVLSGDLFGCSTASHQAASKLDLAAYRIERFQITNAVSLAGSSFTAWQNNFLVFSNSNIRVPLARSAAVQFLEDTNGFDPASLKLQWLKPDELLLISWTTFYLGSGGYTHDGNVILQIRGGQARELFRDHIESVAKGGWAAQQFTSLKIAYNDTSKTLQFTRSHTDINGDMGVPDIRRPYPFTTIFTNDSEEAGYISIVNTIDTWDYKLAASKLKFLRGSSAVDVGDDGQPVEEIAKGFNITRAALELMNPGLRGQHTATGVVILNEKLKPYQVSDDDGLGGDKPD